MIKVFITEDHTIVREGIMTLLALDDDIEVVGWADNGESARKQIAFLNPDVALLDISMPKLNGIHLARALSNEVPDVKKIILSMYPNREYVRQSVITGCDGYLLKFAAAAQLREAIHTVYGGETFYSTDLRNMVAEIMEDPYMTTRLIREELSEREKEVLRLIAKGYTSKDIGESLSISIRTVEKHRENVKSKLDIHDTAGLVHYAVTMGI